jgi:hypothetical protein
LRLIPPGWVVFLSWERYRGPLTFNLQAGPSAWPRPAVGAPVRLWPDRIEVPGAGFAVFTDQAKPWEAPAPAGELLSPAQRQAQLLSICRRLPARQPASPLAALLPAAPGMQALPGLPDVFVSRSARLQAACQPPQAEALAEALSAFLGLGSGLTPSGDDLVIGFLLACNRWREQLCPGLEMAALNTALVARAAHLTSTLSANLIACAARGQADERLALALDGLLTGKPGAPACAAALAAWGNSSGLDALAGMAIALKLADSPI